MNVISTTANKVLELEKRLDNQLTDKSIRVSEVNKTIESSISGETLYNVLTFDAENDLSVVVQGELDVNVESETELEITLILDGFEVYSKSLMLAGGDHSVSIMKALNLASSTRQELVMRIRFMGTDELYVKGYSFFVWGYGESLELGVSSTEPKLSATEKMGRYAICFSLDGNTYVYYGTGFPENLTFANLAYLGPFSYVEPIYEDPEESESVAEEEGGTVTDDETTTEDGESAVTGDEAVTEEVITNLLMFAIAQDGTLYQFSGEQTNISKENGTKIDEDVVSVSATKVKVSDEIVVVYAKKTGEIKYFSLVDGARSEIMTLVTFEEKVSEVALIHNCETTTFLVVGLESGRNYLYSSVTAVAWSDKLSHISFGMEVSFQ